MPIYEFVCTSCGIKNEDLVPLDTIDIVCRKCGGVAAKVMSAPSFILKGGGWSTDSYSKSSKTSKAKEKSE